MVVKSPFQEVGETVILADEYPPPDTAAHFVPVG
jgi:hypothetical protein